MPKKNTRRDVIAQSKASELFMDSSSNENAVLFCMKNELFMDLQIVEQRKAVQIRIHTDTHLYGRIICGSTVIQPFSSVYCIENTQHT